jgi:cupin fold WbuC family metalloprotein
MNKTKKRFSCGVQNNMKRIEFINNTLLNEVSEQAKASPRLRMNYNFHQSLDEKCHRMLNAVEPGTEIPIHHHPTKDETFILMRGKIRVLTYNDDGTVIDDIILSQETGNYGVNIPKNVWHSIQCIEPAVIFECKEGPFVRHEEEGILELPKKRKEA